MIALIWRYEVLEEARPAFEATLDIFEHAKLITKRHKYEDVVAQPPAE